MVLQFSFSRQTNKLDFCLLVYLVLLVVLNKLRGLICIVNMAKDTLHCRSCLCVMTLIVYVHSEQSSVNDKHVSLAVMK